MIFIYIIGFFIVSSLLMAWFDTTLMVHVLHVFRRLGWRKNTEFWDPIPEHTTTRQDIESYLSVYGKYPLLVDLLCCPICLSFHISFMVALCTYFLCDTTIAFTLGQTFSYPILANILYTVKNKLD